MKIFFRVWYVIEYFLLLGAKSNPPPDFLFSIEIEVKTFFWWIHQIFRSFFGFDNLIWEALRTYPVTVKLLPKFKKSNYNQIKKSSLRNDIYKHFKHKCFCNYLFSWAWTFVADQFRKHIFQVLKLCVYDNNIRFYQVSNLKVSLSKFVFCIKLF